MAVTKKSRIAERKETANNSSFNKYEKLYQETFGTYCNGGAVVPFNYGQKIMVALYWAIKDLGDNEGAELMKNQLCMWGDNIKRAASCIIGLPNSPTGNAVQLVHIEEEGHHLMGIMFHKDYMSMAKASLEGSSIEVYQGTTLKSVFSKIA